MFDTVVQKLVKVIGADLFIPCCSVGSSENLSPLALVERKASKWWLGSNSYYTTNFTLQNVLDQGELKVVVEAEKDLVAFNKTSTLKVNGSLSAHFKEIFEAELSDVDSITLNAKLGDLHLTEVNEQSLLDQLKNRKLNMQHELVRELADKHRRALCVVIGVVKTTAPTTITATLNFKLDADEKVNVPASTGGEEVKGDVEKDRTRTLNLPVGTVLAYQVVELAVGKGGAMRVMVSHGSKGGFHSNIVDEVDSPLIAAVDPDAVRNGYKNLSQMELPKRQDLVVKLLKICADPKLLLQFATLLNFPDTHSENGLVQAALDCMVDHRKDAVTTAVQLMVRSLRNLGGETLGYISSVKPEELPLLAAVIERTYHGGCLTHKEGKTQQLITEAGAPLLLLTAGLNYSLEVELLRPPTECQHILNSAYAAVSGLLACYGGGDNFKFD